MKTNKQRREYLFKQGLKQCPRCPVPKSLREFSNNSAQTDDLQVYCKEHRKEDRIQNKQKNKKYDKEYHDNNKEKTAKQQKEYRDIPENKQRILKKNKEYIIARLKTDKAFQISHCLRSRIYSALKGNTKSLSTMFLIGCDVDYLMYHLQSQFTKGMSWDNYGDWHIDHIKPCAKFDLGNPKQQELCFNFTNLQPLWAEDNLKKSDKYCEY